MANEAVAQLILETVQQREPVDTFDLAKEYGKDHQVLVGAVKSLQAMGHVIIKLGPYSATQSS